MPSLKYTPGVNDENGISFIVTVTVKVRERVIESVVYVTVQY